jgi:flagellar biosynthesis/type III secretory pathway M-ring protein FliF/YscJ
MIFELAAIFVLLFIIIGLVYQFMFDIWIWVLLVSVVFYICYFTVKLVFHYRKRNETPMKQQVVEEKSAKQEQKAVKTEQKVAPKQDSDIQRLVSFIVKNKKDGFKTKIIRSALLKQGWPAKKVEEAFKQC